MHYLVKDIDFQKILKFLKTIKYLHLKNKKRLRKFLEAIFYVTRTGCQWRMLPFFYGDWRAVHKRFKKWSDNNIWFKLFEYIKQDPDMEYIIVDSTVVRAHACAAGYKKDSQNEQALGRSRGGFSTKIHILSDALGNPLKYLLSPGQENDIEHAQAVVSGYAGENLLGDKGYDANDFIDYVKSKNMNPVIPPRQNRKEQREYDKNIYASRSNIEISIGFHKHYRRIFSRFEKCASVFMSFLHLVGVFIWLR